MAPPKEPPKTLLVFRALCEADDFMTVRQIVAACGGQVTAHQAQSVLGTLKTEYTAVDCVESGGRLHWYATPDQDKRQKHLELRKPEDRPRGKPLAGRSKRP